MANYTGGPEWGRYMQQTSPTTRFTDAFLTSFKEGMAYKLAQEKSKREEQNKAQEQKAMEDYKNLQMMVKQTEMKQAQEEQAAKEARLREQWEAGAPEREVDVKLKEKKLEQMGQPDEMTPYQKAQIGLGYKRLEEDEEQDSGKSPTGLQSPLAVNIVKQMEDAANAGDIGALHGLFKQAELKKNQMGSVTTGKKGETTRTNPDYSKVVNRYKELVDKMGGKTTTPYTADQKLVTAWTQAQNKGSNALLLDLAAEIGADNLLKTLYQRYGKTRVDKGLKKFKK